MVYREIIAVCSQTHKKHTNTLCGRKVKFVFVKSGGTYSDQLVRALVATRTICFTMRIFPFYPDTVRCSLQFSELHLPSISLHVTDSHFPETAVLFTAR
jgi:hypothetical protein